MGAVCFIALGLLLGQAEEEPKTAADLKAAVTRLARQLDDNQLAKREAAEKELTALGPAALPYLPNINRQTPAEVKDRLTRIRRVLESAAAESATRTAKITLQGEMKLSQALAELSKQSGNQLIDFRDRFGQQRRELTVKVDYENKPFWLALDDLLDQASMTTYSFSGQRGALAVVGRSENEAARVGRAAYGGMFRFEATKVEAQRDLRNSTNNFVRILVDMNWEPRLQPIIITQPLESLKVIGDNDEALEVDGREGEIEVQGDGETPAAELAIPLKLPPRNVTRVKSIKGKLDVLAPGRLETFEFGDLEKARNVEQKRAAVTVFLDQVRKNLDVFEVRMRVKFEAAGNALESHRDWVYNNPAQMLDPNGKQVDNAGMEATLQEDNEVGVAYQFVVEGSLKGYKFVYTTPASIVKIPIEYELKDIELP